MSYSVQIDTKAAKEIKSLPKNDRARLVGKIEMLGANPRPTGSTKLEGSSGLWRIRLGVYRILYQIQDARLLVIVVKVGHRRDVYRGI